MPHTSPSVLAIQASRVLANEFTEQYTNRPLQPVGPQPPSHWRIIRSGSSGTTVIQRLDCRTTRFSRCLSPLCVYSKQQKREIKRISPLQRMKQHGIFTTTPNMQHS
ncbi:hypothetical protein NDU88_004906 [Pleurodeles waltl]|uniref:Uncharacterized protein n=1 Tax=Pleurodeles waltl TaxID=8319 RepID=A0AAV7RH15_PLEWA|nr:hypothetical protein NDU88_004906 [Pleurodeles waltl]